MKRVVSRMENYDILQMVKLGKTLMVDMMILLRMLEMYALVLQVMDLTLLGTRI